MRRVMRLQVNTPDKYVLDLTFIPFHSERICLEIVMTHFSCPDGSRRSAMATCGVVISAEFAHPIH
jgi:hypothetical protein